VQALVKTPAALVCKHMRLAVCIYGIWRLAVSVAKCAVSRRFLAPLCNEISRFTIFSKGTIIYEDQLA
jgi:hypothetical protein